MYQNTETLLRLPRKGSSFTARDVVHGIKESQYCIPSTSNFLDKSYELSDNQIITIGSERFRYPEALFQSLLLGSIVVVFMRSLIIQ
ncbi:Actin, cytoplasmic 1 [Trichinella papuae]|uniref:Actin, cytoplasmic 1 n=1 Tax=Trichinella papuae TaxID=268474 RepID=A0A0V1N3J8_9BILA|nr:Actin, cytoplasmic 1 [Trichinella papuae]